MNLPWCKGRLGTMLKSPCGGPCARRHPWPASRLRALRPVLLKRSPGAAEHVCCFVLCVPLLICYFDRQSDATKETIS